MDKKEVFAISLAVILMTIILSFSNQIFYEEKLFSNFIISLIIITASISAKELVAKRMDVDITHRTWQLQRYWFSRSSYLKKPLPIGILFPILISFISEGYWKFLAFLEYTTKALPAKIVRRYGPDKRFPNVNEWDEAMISFYAVIAVLSLAIISKSLSLYGFSTTLLPLQELAKYALYYGIFNMIPFGFLDGSKIFFGSRPLYIFSLILLIATGLIVFF